MVKFKKKDLILMICGILSVLLAIGYISYTYYESNYESKFDDTSNTVEIKTYTIPEKYKHNRSSYYKTYHKNHIIFIPDMDSKQNIFAINKKEYYVLFERTGCEYCKEIRPVIRWFVDTKKEKSNLYFVKAEINTKYGSDTSSYIYTMKKDPTILYLKGTNDQNWWIPGTPTLFCIKDGKIKNIYIGPKKISKQLIKAAT